MKKLTVKFVLCGYTILMLSRHHRQILCGGTTQQKTLGLRLKPTRVVSHSVVRSRARNNKCLMTTIVVGLALEELKAMKCACNWMACVSRVSFCR